MRIFDGVVYRDMTPAEITEITSQQEQAEREQFYATVGQPMSDAELLTAILASVERGAMPRSGKEGYVLKETYIAAENRTIWEYIPDPYYVPTADGSYLHPITYVDGMTVQTGLWYTDGSDIWECIKDGVPTGFGERAYFDIIG